MFAQLSAVCVQNGGAAAELISANTAPARPAAASISRSHRNQRPNALIRRLLIRTEGAQRTATLWSPTLPPRNDGVAVRGPPPRGHRVPSQLLPVQLSQPLSLPPPRKRLWLPALTAPHMPVCPTSTLVVIYAARDPRLDLD